MRTSRVPLLAVVCATVALAGCGGSDGTQETSETEPANTTAPDTTATSPAPQPTPITIRIVGGSPQGGIARPKVDKGSRVVVIVRSDAAHEVHLHGYDISRDVVAGGTARLSFVADIPGRFEIELEDNGVQLAELTVQ